jgi:hypothetical protein
LQRLRGARVDALLAAGDCSGNPLLAGSGGVGHALRGRGPGGANLRVVQVELRLEVAGRGSGGLLLDLGGLAGRTRT